jgi:hypothetical protein
VKEGGSLLFDMSLYLQAVQSILHIDGEDWPLSSSVYIVHGFPTYRFISVILSLQLATRGVKLFD